ncbi:hypothetical protein ACTXT7_014393 [Hymenolepis weldensis]
MRKLKPLSIEVGSMEERFGPSSESVSTLVGSVTPQGFSPGHQEQSESEMEKKLEGIKIDLEKIPQKPKSSPNAIVPKVPYKMFPNRTGPPTYPEDVKDKEAQIATQAP